MMESWKLLIIQLIYVSIAAEKCDHEGVQHCFHMLETRFASQFSRISSSEKDLDEFCRAVVADVVCLHDESNTCRDEIPNIPVVRDVISHFVTSLCSANSRRRALYMQKSICLVGIKNELQECAPIISNEEQDQKAICREYSIMTKCLEQKSEHECGFEGRKVMKIMLNPWKLFMKLQCVDSKQKLSVAEFTSEDPTCDKDEMIDCIRKGSNEMRLSYIFFKDTESQLNDYCTELKKRRMCFSMSTQGCSDLQEFELMRNVFDSFLKSFCVADSNERKWYLKNSKCLASEAKEFEKCEAEPTNDKLSDKELKDHYCRNQTAEYECVLKKSKMFCEKDGESLMEAVVSPWKKKLIAECNSASESLPSKLGIFLLLLMGLPLLKL